jgi:hypothetical protein
MEQNGRSGWVFPSVSLKLCADDSFHVFKEDDSWLNSSYCIFYVWEEVPWVFIAFPLSCGGERLAREAARDNLQARWKRFQW